MAQVLNNQTIPQLGLSNEQTSALTALSKLTGQSGILQSTPSGALSLTVLGQTIMLPKLTEQIKSNTIQQAQKVTINIKQSATQTILELAKPSTQLQSVQLTPTQGQQLLNVAAQSPIMLQQNLGNEVKAKVLQLVGEQATLQVANKTITIRLPQAAAKLQEGQTVMLKLQNTGQNWQLDVKPETKSSIKIQPAQQQVPNLISATLPKNVALPIVAEDKLSLLQIQRVLPAQLQASFPITEAQLTSKPELGKQPAIPPQSGTSANQSQSGTSITVDNKGQLKIQWQALEQVLAKVPLEGQVKQQAIDIVAKTLMQGDNIATAKATIATQNNQTLADKNPLPSIKESITKAITSRLLGKQEPSSTPTPEAQLKTPTQQTEVAAEAATKPVRPTLNAEQAQQLKSILTPMLRTLQAKADTPHTIATAIEKVLTTITKQIDSPLGQYINELSKQSSTTPINPTQTQATPQEIKQLLTASPIPFTTTSLTTVTSPTPNNAALSGLVGMLQVTLAARLAKQQPHQLDKLIQTLSPMLPTSNGKPPTKQQMSKGLGDLLQIDSNQQLLKSLDKFAATHQLNKLRSAESQLQGQDSLYYVLPIGQQGKNEDVELLIKKEPERESQSDKKKQTSHYWALTMKLPVGEIGQVLAKAKLREQELELDFYTSNTETKELVFNFIPILKKRMKQLGIAIDKCHCQLGKIPDALQDRPYHLFEAKA